MTKTVLFLLLTSLSPLAGAEPRTLLIHQRLPYYSIDADGNIGGLIGGLADDIFRRSGLDYRWQQTSANAQLRRIKADLSPVCAVGWFKNPDREAYARFSAPIYRDLPFVVVARSGDTRVPTHRSIESLLSDQRLTIGTKLGYSYGALIDARIRTLGPRQTSSSQDFRGMLRMLGGKRFDYLFSSAEEAEAVFDEDPQLGKRLVSLRFEDLPPGNQRYILCSRKVDESAIAALNKAIRSPR